MKMNAFWQSSVICFLFVSFRLRRKTGRKYERNLYEEQQNRDRGRHSTAGRNILRDSGIRQTDESESGIYPYREIGYQPGNQSRLSYPGEFQYCGYFFQRCDGRDICHSVRLRENAERGRTVHQSCIQERACEIHRHHVLSESAVLPNCLARSG